MCAAVAFAAYSAGPSANSRHSRTGDTVSGYAPSRVMDGRCRWDGRFPVPLPGRRPQDSSFAIGEAGPRAPVQLPIERATNSFAVGDTRPGNPRHPDTHRAQVRR